MNGISQNDPKVVKAAEAGIPWAIKLRSRGWRSLRTNQKLAARAFVGSSAPSVAIVPRVTRLVRGNPQRTRRNPQQPGNAADSTTITKSDFVADVIGNTTEAGTVTSWLINPSNVVAFPSLLNESARWEKYKITKFSIRFSSKCSEYTDGGVVVQFASDSTDAVPTSKYGIMQSQCRADASAHGSVLLNCAVDPKVRFVRDSSADSGKVVDYGRVNLCAYGQKAADPSIIGELFFEYTIVFSEARVNRGVTQYQYLLTDSVDGPSFASVTSTSAELTFTFNLPGKYTFICSFTGTVSGLYAADLTYNWSVDNTTAVAGVVTVTSPGATLSWAIGATVTSLLWQCNIF
ncbi:putative coat protein [Trailing lespedeza virus 1]|uniref:Capsid protein n=1 Tax=Trailing lespedeza virus 1 TaxID=944580 RepID=F1BA33_9TOMB|nr:putative coat protein [Trailing lespedeza virus 1]ADY69096.1 putative coat protein [Trailing lespedeza virus 1]